MTKLTEIIDAASESSITTSDLLRKVQTVAFRLKAESVLRWVKKELVGYESTDHLPAYRGPLSTPVRGKWVGPAGSIESEVSKYGVEEEFVNRLFKLTIPQSVADLESLAASQTDPSRSWPPEMTDWYDNLVATKKGGVGYEYMCLLSAYQVIPRNTVVGIIDTIRTSALELALELEAVPPEAGEPGGPTTSNEGVQNVVNNFTTNVYGDGNNVAAGSDIHQKSKVKKGDLGGLLAAAGKLGLSEDGLAELREAVTADGGTPGPRTNSFLDRVRAGTFSIASGVTSNIAADQLMQLTGAFFGQ